MIKFLKSLGIDFLELAIACAYFSIRAWIVFVCMASLSTWIDIPEMNFSHTAAIVGIVEVLRWQPKQK